MPVILWYQKRNDMTALEQQLISVEMSRSIRKDACDNLFEKAIEVYHAAASVIGREPGFTYSSTEAGESYYVSFNTGLSKNGWNVVREIRISDHDCGVFRMQDQMQVRVYTPVNQGDIELFFFQEQYKPVYKQIGVKVGQGTAEAKDFVQGPGVTSIEHFTAKSGKLMVRYTYEKIETRFAGYQKVI
jgi:hypothetical protein